MYRLRKPNYNETKEDFFSISRPQHQIDEYFYRKRQEEQFEMDKFFNKQDKFQEALNKGEVDNTNDWNYNEKTKEWEVVG